MKRTPFGLPDLATDLLLGNKTPRLSNKKNFIHDAFIPCQNKPGMGECRYCHKIMSDKNTTRRKEHLLNSSVCSFLDHPDALNSPDSQVIEHLQAKNEAQKAEDLDNPIQSAALALRAQKRMKESLTYTDNQRLQMLFAQMMYTTDMSFHWVEHPTVKEFFTALRSSFKLPTREELATPLLIAVYTSVVNLVLEALKQAMYVTITIDTWRDSLNGERVFSFQACSYGQTLFVDMTTCKEDKMDVDYIKTKITSIATDHGLTDKLAAVVMETSPVMKEVCQELEAHNPRLICFGCTSHLLSSFLSDVTSLPVVKALLNQSKEVVTFFKGNAGPHRVLQQFQEVHGLKKELEFESKSSAGSVSTMLRSLILNKESLKSAVQNPVLHPTDGARTSEQAMSAEICATILSEQFWNGVELLQTMVFEKVVFAIISFENETTTLADAYFMLKDIELSLQTALTMAASLNSNLHEPLQHDTEGLLAIWKKRVLSGWNDAFALASYLHPKYYQLWAVIQQSDRVAAERCLAKIVPNQELYITIMVQWRTLRTDSEKLGIPSHAFLPGVTEDPLAWWADYGENCKELRAVAQRLANICPSVTAGQRNFSSYSKVWLDKRSQLLNQRVSMLVYIYFNSRILGRGFGKGGVQDWDDFLEYLETLPPIQNSKYQEAGRAELPAGNLAQTLMGSMLADSL